MKTSTKIIIVILLLGAILGAFAAGFYVGQDEAAKKYEAEQTQLAASTSNEQNSSSQSQGDTSTQKPVIPEGGGYAGSSSHGI